jgi:hypothetical protein
MHFAVFVGGVCPFPTMVDDGAVPLIGYCGCWFDISSWLSVNSVDRNDFAVSWVLGFLTMGILDDVVVVDSEISQLIIDQLPIHANCNAIGCSRENVFTPIVWKATYSHNNVFFQLG